VCYDSVEALHAGVERANPKRPEEVEVRTAQDAHRNALSRQYYQNSVERLKVRREFLAADDLLKTESRAKIELWGKFETLLDQSIAFTALGTGNQLYVADADAIKTLRKEIPGWYALEMLDGYRKAAETDATSKYRYLKTLAIFGHDFVGLSKNKQEVATTTELGTVFHPKSEPDARDVWPYRQRDKEWSFIFDSDHQRNPVYGDVVSYGKTRSYSSYWDAAKALHWVHRDDDAAISEYKSSSAKP
jgi:hypothetical protein